MYRFEQGIDSAVASQSGRLSYVGLSGGFGSVTLGQIWSASYNSFGAITDNSRFYGDSQTTYRHGNAISYAFSNDLMALQVDAVYDDAAGKADPNEDLERVEFGLSVNIGDIGKVAVAYMDDKYEYSDGGTAPTKPADVLTGATFAANDGDDTTWRVKTTSVAGEVSVAGITAYVGSQTKKSTDGAGAGTNSSPDAATIADKEQKTTFFGVRGGVGDTGIDYIFQMRDIKDMNKPWILGMGKSLGGGASVSIEHEDKDDEMKANRTRISLQVNF